MEELWLKKPEVDSILSATETAEVDSILSATKTAEVDSILSATETADVKDFLPPTEVVIIKKRKKEILQERVEELRKIISYEDDDIEDNE